MSYGLSGGVETYDNRGTRRTLGRGLRRFVVLLIVIVIAAGVWITRDTTPRWRLIPDGQKLTLIVHDPLERRDRIVQSGIWEALAPIEQAAEIRKELAAELPMPEWMLRNLMGEMVYLTANDLESLSDTIVVTRMSRVGTLVERLGYWFSADIESDPAGGLNLRRAPGGELFYAVRGRSLLLSPSRNALIHSLTLVEDAAVTPEMFDELVGRNGSEDIRGAVRFDSDSLTGRVVDRVSFALRVDRDRVELRCRGNLTDEWRSRLEPLLANAEPTELLPPPEGPVQLAFNLGLATPELVAAMERAAIPDRPPQWWESLAAAGVDDEGKPGAGFFVSQLLRKTGPAAAVAIVGHDPHEVIPVPHFVAHIQGGANTVRSAGLLLGGDNEVLTDVTAPVFDKERGTVTVPLVGGTSLHPTVAAYGEDLLIGNSAPVIQNLAASPPPSNGPGPANVYAAIRPAACVDMARDLAMEFAKVGMLRGYTAESFEMEAERWRSTAAPIEQARLAASHEAGAIEVRVEIGLAVPERE